MLNKYYEPSSNSTCTEGLGVMGVYCLLCKPSFYFDEDAARCISCAGEAARVMLFIFGLIAMCVLGALASRYRLLTRIGWGAAWHKLVIVAGRTSAQTKLKICISYYQIITQLDRVYAVVYPPAYARIVKQLGLVFHLFFGWVPGVATACTGLHLAHELYILSCLPLFTMLVPVGIAAYRGDELITALPVALVVSFLSYPFVASRGFRALAPCDCFQYIDGGEACFLHDAYSVRCVPDDAGGYSAPLTIRVAAWIAILIYAVLLPIVYASLLLVCRRSLCGSAPPTKLSQQVSFLSKDYVGRAFAWELIEVARKIIITGFLALVDPGSLLQLYMGVTVSIGILILQLYMMPYNSISDNFLSAMSASALVLTLLGSLGVQLLNLYPDLTALGRQTAGLDSSSLDFIVFILVVTALLVLVTAIGMFVRSLATARELPIARLKSSGEVAAPRALPPKHWHCFVSHQWGSGQDQARAIKMGLSALCGGLRTFLDVDDLTDIGSLEALVGATDCVIIFLAGSRSADGTERSAYMKSPNCIREFATAVQLQKTIVFVRETDPQHGAVSIETHRRDCPNDDLRTVLDVAIADGSVVPWYRVRCYMLVSLRLILEKVLGEALSIHGDISQSSHDECWLSTRAPDAFHLYAPPDTNKGAAEVISLLTEEASRLGATLEVTSIPEERARAHRTLLYLNRSTFTTEDDQRLEAEISAALADKQQLLLVHEQRGGGGSVEAARPFTAATSLEIDHGACPFAEIMAHTPRSLLSADVYAELAEPLYDGAHGRVCLRRMLDCIGSPANDGLLLQGSGALVGGRGGDRSWGDVFHTHGFRDLWGGLRLYFQRLKDGGGRAYDGRSRGKSLSALHAASSRGKVAVEEYESEGIAMIDLRAAAETKQPSSSVRYVADAHEGTGEGGE